MRLLPASARNDERFAMMSVVGNDAAEKVVCTICAVIGTGTWGKTLKSLATLTTLRPHAYPKPAVSFPTEKGSCMQQRG